ncbi:MAG TPA: tRNA (adenosine(37)-N6)-threonylcarbamoyltransferase complex dimerization subunit type 1 TsaB [Solirubrobacterales bacterium]|nr:tRNA (adenosine(37)-N6)-threonylcarbamoyltransferase complex dimerization subunit type 1 TsaB [Solirubrobacterales bacterium]
MVVLGVDTATPDAVVGVRRSGEVLREARVPPGTDGRPNHARFLLPEIERSVEAAGGWDCVERIAVGIGPGSFTGLRIGISTARALAQARGTPIAPVGSLASLARGIVRDGDATEGVVLPVIDARRGEVFAALFDGDATEIWEPLVTPPAELGARLRELGKPCLAAGDGALRFAAELEAAGVMVAPPRDPIHHLTARDVCAEGEAASEAPPDQIQPLYLRPPDAKRWIERDRSAPGG